MIKTDAIVLKKADLNEVDRLLTIYTEKLGKIKISAKGVKKVESKLRYSIEPVSYVQMILVEGKNFLILKDAIIKNQFLNIKKDLERLKAAKQIIEIIDEAIIGEEKDENIWKLILITFEDLNNADFVYAKALVNKFKNNIIKLLGYDPRQVKEIENIY